jgi:hypothetical protein
MYFRWMNDLCLLKCGTLFRFRGSSMSSQAVQSSSQQSPAQVASSESSTSGTGPGQTQQDRVGNQAIAARTVGGAGGGDARDPTAAASTCASLPDFGIIVTDAASADADVLAAMASLQRSNTAAVGQVVADATMMHAALNKLGTGKAALGLLHFQFGAAASGGRALKDAIKLLIDTVGLTAMGWARLQAGRESQQLAEVIGWPEVFAAVCALPGDPLILMPGLAMDPAMLRHVVSTYPEFIVWVRERGGNERVQQVMAHIEGQTTADAVRAMMEGYGLWDRFLATLPDGPATDPDGKRLLYYFLMNSADGATAEWNVLYKKRFGVELNYGPGDASLLHSGATVEATPNVAFDKPSVVRIWQILDMSPNADAAATQRVIREHATGEASGWAGKNGDQWDLDGDGTAETNGPRSGQREIGMDWSTGQMGATEIGSYTDDSDPMRGLNVFDSTFRHEIGHNVANAESFDVAGGFVYTDFGWDDHYDAKLKPFLTDVVLPAHPLVLAGTPVPGQAARRTAIIDAIAAANSHTVADYQAAVDGVEAGLWATILPEPFTAYLISRMGSNPWNTQGAIGDRSYHISYDSRGWVSVPTARYATKASTYALRSPGEWFAECYATFYAEADMAGQELGALLATRDAAATAAFRAKVHGRHNLAAETGQGTVGVGAPVQRPMGDFPTPRPLGPGDTAYA